LRYKAVFLATKKGTGTKDPGTKDPKRPKEKTDAKYSKLFEFAEKTKNPDNKEEDFLEYMDDEIFCEIMKRINKNSL
jgi:hypothetical protein